MTMFKALCIVRWQCNIFTRQISKFKLEYENLQILEDKTFLKAYSSASTSLSVPLF